MFDADDLAMFNDPDMPGHAIATIDGVAVSGRMKLAPAEVFGMVQGERRYFSAAADDLSTVAGGESIAIDGVDYVVRRIESPDSEAAGMIRLWLSES